MASRNPLLAHTRFTSDENTTDGDRIAIRRLHQMIADGLREGLQEFKGKSINWETLKTQLGARCNMFLGHLARQDLLKRFDVMIKRDDEDRNIIKIRMNLQPVSGPAHVVDITPFNMDDITKLDVKPEIKVERFKELIIE